MRNILVPIDFSASTPAVVEAAKKLAAAIKAQIVLLSVTGPPVVLNEDAPDIEEFIISDREDVGRKLSAYGTQLAAAGLEVEPFERFGPPVECILEEANRTHAEYIVMGSHSHTALYELLIGSTTAGVLKKAPCPVMVVPR